MLVRVHQSRLGAICIADFALRAGGADFEGAVVAVGEMSHVEWLVWFVGCG